MVFSFWQRTPQDYPMASIAIGKWKSGRTRIVVGVLREEVPLLVLDGPTNSGALEATEHMCKTLLVNHKNGTYLSSAIPEMVHRLTQEI